MYYPFMDLSSLTDDQLIEKIQKCQNMLTYEAGMGHSAMAGSIRMQLEAYKFEMQERIATKSLKEKQEKLKDQGKDDNIIEIGTIESSYYNPDDKEE